MARVGKKQYSVANLSSSTVIPRNRTKTELGTKLSIFCGESDSTEYLCAAGEFHSGTTTNNQHVQTLTESWSEMAPAIDDLDVNLKLRVGYVLSNGVFYCKNHVPQFHNRYRASQVKKDNGTDQPKKFLLQT